MNEKIFTLSKKYNYAINESLYKDLYTLSLNYSNSGIPEFTRSVNVEDKQSAIDEAIVFLENYDKLSTTEDWKEGDILEKELTNNALAALFHKYPELEEKKDLKEKIVSSFKRSNVVYSENIENTMAMVLLRLWDMNHIKNVEFDESINIYQRYKDKGQFVRVRPCAKEYENKTFVGLYLGDLPRSVSGNIEEDVFKIKCSMTNPFIYIFETNTFVWGASSWWGNISKPEDLNEISCEDIDNVWYMRLIKENLTPTKIKDFNETICD